MVYPVVLGVGEIWSGFAKSIPYSIVLGGHCFKNTCPLPHHLSPLSLSPSLSLSLSLSLSIISLFLPLGRGNLDETQSVHSFYIRTLHHPCRLIANADSASLPQDGHRSSELSRSLEQSQHDILPFIFWTLIVTLPRWYTISLVPWWRQAPLTIVSWWYCLPCH